MWVVSRHYNQGVLLPREVQRSANGVVKGNGFRQRQFGVVVMMGVVDACACRTTGYQNLALIMYNPEE